MLQISVNFLLYSLLGLNPESRAAQVLNFFVYDSVKIILLLFLMISIIGFLRTYLPQHKVRSWLSGKRGGAGNIIAALFGAISPFCSCSSIPLFLSFLEAGVPLGVTFSFLVTSPLVNEYLVILMLGFFGWKITALYVLSGILIGVFSGVLLGKMNLERYLVKDLVAPQMANDSSYANIRERFSFGLGEASSIVRKLWLWILAGVGIGAVIHNYVPQEAIQSLLSTTGIFAVPLATLIGVPMYGNSAAIVPIAIALFNKGVPLGTALAFMMATAALSLPEAIILRRAMKLKLIAIFFAIVALAIIFTGYLFNLVQISL